MKGLFYRHIIAILVILVSFIFRLISPVTYVFNSPHDDLLAVEQARSILNGDWLGAWNNRTLAKPPGYAIFLALAHLVRIKPEWLIWLIVLISSYFLQYNLSKLLKIESRSQKQIIFAIILLNPTFYSADFSRIHRTSLYTVLTLIFITLFLPLVLELTQKKIESRTNEIVPISIRLAIALGIIYGLMSITRTEGIWILIPLLLTLSMIVVFRIKQSKSKLRVLFTGKFLSVMFVFTIFAAIPTTLVSSANLKTYGVEEVENFYSGSFAEAIKNWQSVVPDEKYPPNISITKSMREKAYKVSPTASTMRDSLESAPNTGWKVFNCELKYPCSESGSWIPWEIRDAAVGSMGLYSETEFIEFFAQLNAEIKLACDKNKIECRSPGTAPMLINIKYLDFNSIVKKSMFYLSTFPNMHQARFEYPKYQETDSNLLKIWSSVMNINSYSFETDQQFKILDWLFSVLKMFYTIFIWISIPLLMYTLVFRALTKKRDLALESYSIFLLLSVLLFCGGLALLEIALGFNPGEWLYGLPAQPLVVTLSILGFFSFYKVFNKAGS